MGVHYRYTITFDDTTDNFGGWDSENFDIGLEVGKELEQAISRLFEYGEFDHFKNLRVWRCDIMPAKTAELVKAIDQVFTTFTKSGALVRDRPAADVRDDILGVIEHVHLQAEVMGRLLKVIAACETDDPETITQIALAVSDAYALLGSKEDPTP